MKQSPEERPIPTLQRKAAIASGGATDHAGRVRVEPIRDFDLDRTIFQTLEGAIPRFVMKARIAKKPAWDRPFAEEVEAAYLSAREEHPLPEVPPELLRFMVEECDFDVEHADGSFLDHLYFGFEYGTQHYPERSPLVLLLHSILGTGTNTFAMGAEKIPALRALMSEFDWKHVEAFPSVLRLLYDVPLRRELQANVHRPDALEKIAMRRVIDNEPIELSGEDFWIQLNYQLIHLVDFLPAANWRFHSNDTSFVVFRDLYDLLERSGKLETKLAYTPATGPRRLEGETLHGIGARLVSRVPDSITERMTAASIRRFSERIGHSLDYELSWG